MNRFYLHQSPPVIQYYCTVIYNIRYIIMQYLVKLSMINHMPTNIYRDFVTDNMNSDKFLKIDAHIKYVKHFVRN